MCPKPGVAETISAIIRKVHAEPNIILMESHIPGNDAGKITRFIDFFSFSVLETSINFLSTFEATSATSNVR